MSLPIGSKGRARVSTTEADITGTDAVDRALETIAAVRAGIAGAVIGQETVVEQTLCAILAGGHAMLVGAPGLAKTTLVEAIAQVFRLDWRRVQFTPDLMPADILGSEVLEEGPDGRRAFRFIEGPVFTSLLVADEINRASPRTQSALLQAMQERHVTVAGVRRDLPAPFHVVATRNPIEQEGAYPLPEAQLDRFLLEVDVGYPDAATERAILTATTGRTALAARPAATHDDLVALQALVRAMPVGERVLDAILSLVRSARPETAARADVRRDVTWGPGPRAGQALSLAVRARALIRGRLAPSLDDVVSLARPALAHRMALGYRAIADGASLSGLIATLAEEATKA